jgi:hypothetical protein
MPDQYGRPVRGEQWRIRPDASSEAQLKLPSSVYVEFVTERVFEYGKAPPPEMIKFVSSYGAVMEMYLQNFERIYELEDPNNPPPPPPLPPTQWDRLGEE